MAASLHIEVISLRDLKTESSTLMPAKQQPLVLVVDDERVIADTLSIILSRGGFTTVTAYDGESALELALAVAPDLLLSDVMLGPGIDGTQLAIELTTELPDCKVILFSGHAATRDLLTEARKLGHDFTLLTKPIHPADLLARITETLPMRSHANA
jgi:CheY-like chemotaxis protein